MEKPELPVAAAKTEPPAAVDSVHGPQSPFVNGAARPKRSQFSPLLIAVAVAGIGSLMLLAASTRSPATPPVHETPLGSNHGAADAPVAAPKNTSIPTRRASSSRWIASGPSRRGYTGITFDLAADEDIDVWRKRVRPVLTVRCTAKETEVFVLTQSAASIEPTGQHTVQMSFDDGDPVAEMWEHSTDHDALFAPEGMALKRQIAGARRMSFTFTPFNASPSIVHFSVAGFDAQLKSASKTCGWKR